MSQNVEKETGSDCGEPTYRCASRGCSKVAKLRCPTCKTLGLNSYFCDQACFKNSWSTHKSLHERRTNQFIGYKYTGDLRPFFLDVTRTVPSHITRPDYADHPRGVSFEEENAKASYEIAVLKPEEIEKSRKVCQLARRVMDEVAKIIRPGITTDYIDQVVHEESVKRSCYPSPLNYYGFPKSCCTSVNEVICHGIPDGYVLKDGDICNVDITLYYDGFHGDLNETFFIGNVSEKYRDLVRNTHECLSKAIEIVKPGVQYKELGNVIQKHANTNGFSVVRTYTGHGCHRLFHCAPNVPHYSRNNAIGTMKVGHIFTIEPMINEGTFADTTWPDDWTVVTMDGKRSAQFEQTLVVTETGCEVLTRRKAKNGQPYFLDNTN